MKIGNLVGHPPDNLEYSPVKDLILSRCFIGIEVELEGLPKTAFKNNLKYWEFRQDGSLRDYVGRATELVSSRMFGKDILNALDELNTFGTKFTPSLSERTSIHIHLDVRNLSKEQVLTLVFVYLIYEQMYFAMAGMERKNSNFCVPLSKTIHELSNIAKTFSKRTGEEDLHYYLGEFSKYSALNLRAIRKFGTLEFRHYPGEFRKNKILEWINAIMALKRFTIRDNMTLDDIFNEINNDFSKFTNNVFRKTIIPSFVNDKFIQDGLISSGMLLSSLKEHQKNKKYRKLNNNLYDSLYNSEGGEPPPLATENEAVRWSEGMDVYFNAAHTTTLNVLTELTENETPLQQARRTLNRRPQ